MRACILTAPHLGRDLSHLQAHLPHAQVLAGPRTVPGEVGCLELHQRAVRLAIDAGWDRVAVCEDDCRFTPAFHWPDWCAAGNWAEAHGYGAVHGGTVKAFGARPAGGTFLAVDYACSAHCMIYLRASFDAVLSAEQPLDWSIGKKGGKPLVIWPFVAIQGAGRSGIGRPTDRIGQAFAGEMHVDYTGSFASQERKLGRLLGVSV